MPCPAIGANRDLAYVPEAVAGITPVDPVMRYLRTTGDSLKGNIEQQTSNELRKGRVTAAPVKGRSSTAGDIPIELSYRSFDEFLAALMYNEWKPNAEATYQDADTVAGTRAAVAGQRKLTLGQTARSFTIMKLFSDKALYRFFKGCYIGGFNLSIPLDGKVTGSFNILGMDNPRMVTTGDPSIPANMVFDPETPHTTDQFNSFVGTCKAINVTTNTGEDVTIATQIDLQVTHNLKQDYALFEEKAICVSPERFGVTGTISMYLTSEQYVNYVNDWTTLKIVFVIEDPNGNMYQFRMPAVKLTDAPDGVNGPESVTIAFPFTAFGQDALDIIAIPSAAEHRALAPILTVTADGFTLAEHPAYSGAAGYDELWGTIYAAAPAGYAIQYVLDGGVQTAYTAPVNDLAPGVHTVEYWATATVPYAASVRCTETFTIT